MNMKSGKKVGFLVSIFVITSISIAIWNIFFSTSWVESQKYRKCDSVGQTQVESLICITKNGSNDETYMINYGLESANAQGDKVVIYSGYQGHRDSGTGWAGNDMAFGEPGSGGFIAREIDVGPYFNCDPGGPVAISNCQKVHGNSPNAIGLLISGLTHDSIGNKGNARAAVEITSPHEKLWHEGISFEGPSIIDSEIFTNSTSRRIMDVEGDHLVGIDLSKAFFHDAGVMFTYGQLGQGIRWKNDEGIVFSDYTDFSKSSRIFGSIGGDTLQKKDGSWLYPGNTYAKGMVVGKAWVGTLHTPSSSRESCTAGQSFDDERFHYVCVEDNKLKRIALQEF